MSSVRRPRGRLFQIRGPTAPKLLSPKLLCVRGTAHMLSELHSASQWNAAWSLAQLCTAPSFDCALHSSINRSVDRTSRSINAGANEPSSNSATRSTHSANPSIAQAQHIHRLGRRRCSLARSRRSSPGYSWRRTLRVRNSAARASARCARLPLADRRDMVAPRRSRCHTRCRERCSLPLLS